MKDLKCKDVNIPVDDIYLKGTVYSKAEFSEQAAWIINLHGLLEHRESPFVKFFTEKFVSSGYYVLSYDYRAHGETAKQTGKNWLKCLPKIFSDINRVIDWLYKTQISRIQDKDVNLFGRSLGGAIILTHGYVDERIKKLIALCTRYDYHSYKLNFPEDVIQAISPKYYLKKECSQNENILLAHCKDDQQIPYENINHIQSCLDLPEENVFRYDNGGHSFKECMDDIFQKSLRFLKK